MAKTGEKPPYQTFDEWWGQLPRKQDQALTGYRDGLLRLYRQPCMADLGWWYDVGVCLKHLFPTEDKRHGHRFMELIADKLEPGRDPTRKNLIVFLYRFRDFAVTYRKSEVSVLKAKVRDGKITADHVTYLLGVNQSNSKTRADFLTETVEKGWSVHDLRRAIQDDKTQGLTKYGGRRPRPRTTSNPALAARDITVGARRWNVCHKQYFARGGPLSKMPTSYSPRLLRELDTSLAGLKQVADQATKALGILEPIVSKMRAKVAESAGKQ